MRRTLSKNWMENPSTAAGTRYPVPMGPVPEPNWIRIQSGQWIRIRNPDPDPDPGGQKLPTKVEKN